MRLSLLPRVKPKYGQDFRQLYTARRLGFQRWKIFGTQYRVPDWNSVSLVTSFNSDGAADRELIELVPQEIPVVVHFQLRWHYLDASGKENSKAVLARANRVIIPASFLADEAPVPHDRVRVVQNGVHSEIFRPLSDLAIMETRKALDIPEGQRVLCFVGSPTNAKGRQILLELESRLPVKWTLVICSTKEQPDWTVGKRLRWVTQSKENPHAAHATPASDAVISLSLCEVAPMAVLEALASGVSVIATRSTPYLDEIARVAELRLVELPDYLTSRSREQLKLADEDASRIAKEMAEHIESLPRRSYEERQAQANTAATLGLIEEQMALEFAKIYDDVETPNQFGQTPLIICGC